ncbi:Lrp/AsnC family transcriptional regulator [Acrocarpospora sp. B8E8]|uniref:Lrp/AsnC family transcriptional regulator n=1 Tax=Acrocarpospora sp. B8E8 TaxID=3153572 RepID=UPI00325EEAFD
MRHPEGSNLTFLDPVDARILLALDSEPRLPVVVLAERLGLARKTVQTRLSRMEERALLRPHSDRVDPRTLGYLMEAAVTAEVEQPRLGAAVAALAEIPEVVAAAAISGEGDLLCRVVARDPDDLYRVTQEILSCPGIRRTRTSLLMRDLLPYRALGLLRRLAGETPSR